MDPHDPRGWPVSARRLWLAFLQHMGEAPLTTERRATVWAFGDLPALQTELASLALIGRKRATASSLWAMRAVGEGLPHVGDYSIITDGNEVAQCVICTTRVEVVPYNQVAADFTHREGEGDGSVAHWRAAHWPYFERVLAPFGIKPAQDMPVVCESFERVWPVD